MNEDLTDEERSLAWKRLKETENFWLKAKPYQENVDALASFLNRTDSVIYYITSRVPTLYGSSVMTQTQRWLESWCLLRSNTSVLTIAQNIDPETYKTVLPPKNAIVQALDIHAHIDDYLPTVVSLGERGWLLDRSWNRDARPQQTYVVPDLKSFLDFWARM